MRLRRLLAVGAVVVAVAGCGSGRQDSPNPAPSQDNAPSVTVTGKVTCTSHANVAGVWVAAVKGDASSGFASWRVPDSNSPWIANYQYTLPHGGDYTVHVGCGQDPVEPQQWVHQDRSEVPVSSPHSSYDCDDPVGDQVDGVCRQVG